MSFSALNIAEYFLARRKESPNTFSAMKLLKLVYIAHGYSLALRGEALINEEPVGFQWGPVIVSIYERLKQYGNEALIDTAISEDKAETLPKHVEELLEAVWRAFGKFSARQLSTICHGDGGAWHRRYQEVGRKYWRSFSLPEQYILDEFKKSLEKAKYDS